MEASAYHSEEHRSLAAILHAVRFTQGNQGRHVGADFGLFKAMVHYLMPIPRSATTPGKTTSCSPGSSGAISEGADAGAPRASTTRAAPGRIKMLEAALLRHERGDADGSGHLKGFDDFAGFIATT